MAAFLRTFFAVILAFFFLATIPLLLAVVLLATRHLGPHEGTWLTIQLSGELLEHYGPVTLRNVLDEHPPTLMEITENLEKAAADDRIQGVVFRLDWFSAGQGKLDEIRSGIRKVREAGKPVYAYGWLLRDAGLYLGSECDSLFLFPKGWVYFLGRGASIEHVKGLLDKLEVTPQFHRIDEYKSAAETFTAEKSSKETIENLTWIVKDLDSSFDSTLVANLELPPETLDALRERAMLLAPDAVDAGLADETLFWDELTDRLSPGGDFRSISSADYAAVSRSELGLSGKPQIAVVHAQGFVSSGGNDRWSPWSGLTMGTDRVVEDLERVREDDRVKAIILRWDTGGGATDGAERISREVARARSEKPVVVSIADQAASGGYMMSFPANTIICPANGITGSIGSITGKLNVRGLWEKIGFSYDDLAFAPNAFLLSDLHDYTEAQWRRIDEVHWKFYNDWVADIAKARGLSFEQVDEAAQGRVWTGRQAKDRELVDELGGFDEALKHARRLADLDEDEEVGIVHYPEKQTIVDLLLQGEIGMAFAQDLVLEAREALFESVPRNLVLQHFARFRLE